MSMGMSLCSAGIFGVSRITDVQFEMFNVLVG